jgi:hypothetical protein
MDPDDNHPDDPNNWPDDESTLDANSRADYSTSATVSNAAAPIDQSVRCDAGDDCPAYGYANDDGRDNLTLYAREHLAIYHGIGQQQSGPLLPLATDRPDVQPAAHHGSPEGDQQQP